MRIVRHGLEDFEYDICHPPLDTIPNDFTGFVWANREYGHPFMVMCVSGTVELARRCEYEGYGNDYWIIRDPDLFDGYVRTDITGFVKRIVEQFPRNKKVRRVLAAYLLGSDS